MNNSADDNYWSQDTLTFLYELSSTINATENSIHPCAGPLKLITQKLVGSAAVIRLISEEGWMDLYDSYGMDKEQITDLQHTPIEGSLFVHESRSIKEIRRSPASTLINDKTSELISIPVRHHGHTLGVLNVFIPDDQFHLDDETALMLLASGQHFGLAIEKHRLENAAKQKLIQEERNMIANELHDSLAQTLASLRFQVRILDQTLQPTSDYMAIMSLEQVEHGLDEAYTDLRELIAHCRVPIEQQGLLPSIERVVSKFREETGIHILLQCECQDPDVPANMEMNIYRIVQEALTNIKKHANAHIVRVLLSCNDKGQFRILVENDGEGFDKKAIKSKEGQHLGLTIMQERARHLGGQLRIESEPEEGTRIELKFRYLREQAE
ncbi:MAG: histidine kinase [Gammaproteobacteria bacterium]|nr:histidine kinase [Gammaproteobacteria bacterium]